VKFSELTVFRVAPSYLLGALAVALLVVAISSTSGVLAESSEPTQAVTAAESDNLLLSRLKRIRPDIPIDSVYPSPIPGILAMEVEGGGMIYGTEDGKFMIAGDLYSIGDIELVNLAEQRREIVRKELMAAVKADEAWVFKPVGQTKAVVSVFTDVDCGYCRKLHGEVPRLNELGIEVRYLAFPRAGIGSSSYNTIVSAWCADDRGTALTDAKSGKSIVAKTCVNPVAEQYQLGQEVGVTGTPAIVTDSGKLLPGYMPADILAQTLGLPTS